jgi:sigma-B regulation protein RsbU (phosphoserine phosphatase)
MNDDSVIGQKPASILIVDDTAANLQVLTGMLEDKGYRTRPVTSGKMALQAARNEPPDLVLLDITMPEMDGYEVCALMKADEKLKDIPVIFISALHETLDKVKGFSVGGLDYVTKPFQFEEVHARVETHLKLRRLQFQLEEQNCLLVESRKTLMLQLSQAADYVLSLIPPPIRKGSIRTDWRLIPSFQLGGDSFGYHWIDKDHFAFYLLDVSGHGVGPALLSVSMLNMIRSQSLPDVDFRMPAQVLRALNRAFPMEKHHDFYCTAWYGVFNKVTRKLRYSGGGHQPALILNAAGESTPLPVSGPVLGWDPESVYEDSILKVGSTAELCIFSDGCFEVRRTDGHMWKYEEFEALLIQALVDGVSDLDALYGNVRKIGGKEVLEDDFSILKVSFT